MPSPADLEIYQGDDFAPIVTIYNEDGSVADITGYTAKAQIRRSTADNDPVVVVEITAVVQSPQVLMSIPSAQTTPLSGRYTWDLQITSPDGVVTTVLAGRVIVTAEITRAVA